MAALLERQAALSALPSEPDGWIDEPTGETFADLWNAAANDLERREFLLSTGAKFTLTAHEGAKPGEGTWTIRMDRGETSRDYRAHITRVDGEPVLANVGRPLGSERRGTLEKA
jgi:hypothetical protein